MNFTSDSKATIIKERFVKANGEMGVWYYSQGKFLGKGGFAKCYEFTDLQSNKILAAKIVLKSSLVNKPSAKEKLLSEIHIHRGLNHTNIVKCEHCFEDKHNVYILLELCSNQALSDILKRRIRLTEIEVRCYLIQIISGLKYLHEKNIIHRDLKLANLFITDQMELKIGDFGLAAKITEKDQLRKSLCGTPNYIAPEIVERRGHSYPVDIWSLGIICYTLLVGKPPFETPNIKDTINRIIKLDYKFPEKHLLSEEAKSLISSILQKYELVRPTLDEILEHKFFSKTSIPKYLPISTLACPPTASYLKNLLLEENKNVRKEIMHKNKSLEEHMTVTIPKFGSASKIILSSTRINIEKEMKTRNSSPNSEEILIINQLNDKNTIEITKKPDLSATDSFKQKPNFKTLNYSNGRHSTSRKSSANDIKLKDDLSNLNSTRKTSYSNILGNKIQTTNLIQPLPLNSNTITPSKSKYFQNDESENYTASPFKLKTLNSLNSTPVIKNHIKKEENALKEVWIKKCVDLSSKYGIGYLLTNNTIGFLFNDGTTLLMNSNYSVVFSIIRHPKDKNKVITLKHTSTFFPEKFSNKMKIFLQFQKHLLKENDEDQSYSPKSQVLISSSNDQRKNLVYIKKFMKAQYATMYRLNDKMIQVNFVDNTIILMNVKSKMVTYIKKNNNHIVFDLRNAFENQDASLTKRMNYIRGMIINIDDNKELKSN